MHLIDDKHLNNNIDAKKKTKSKDQNHCSPKTLDASLN